MSLQRVTVLKRHISADDKSENINIKFPLKTFYVLSA